MFFLNRLAPAFYSQCLLVQALMRVSGRAPANSAPHGDAQRAERCQLNAPRHAPDASVLQHPGLSCSH